MLLNRLAGHTAEFASFATLILTLPGIAMQTPSDPRRILRTETRVKLIAEFDDLAAGAMAALKTTTDTAFDGTWTLSRSPWKPPQAVDYFYTATAALTQRLVTLFLSGARTFVQTFPRG